MFRSSLRAAVAIAVALSATLAAPQPARADPEAVSLSIDNSGQYWPDYRLQVRNATPRPVNVIVRQELPKGTGVSVISAGGRAEQNELVWRVRVPARNISTLTASLTHSGAVEPLISPACAYQRRGERPYDCASAAWTPPPQLTPAETPPWWRQPERLVPPAVGALAALMLLWGLARVIRRRRRGAGRPRVGPAPRSPERVLAPPPAPRRRRRPPAVVVLGLVVVLLAVGVAAGTGAAAFGAHTMGFVGKPRAGGWVGTAQTGPIGAKLREASFDITVYRVACRPDGADKRRCVATVGVRNHTNKNQLWYAALQRAYLPSGTWVGADEAATREANGGRDIFAEPVAPGQRLLAPIAFTVAGELLPSRIELRSGVFSAGVGVAPG